MKKTVLLLAALATAALCFAQTTINYSAFGDSIEDNDTAAVQKYIKDGADLQRTVGWGFKPLTRAARYHAYDAAKQLIAAGAGINALDSYECLTPLAYAVKYNDLVMADLLLKAKASPDVPSETGDTPLHMATMNKNVQMVKLLLMYNAGTGIKNNSGKTAFAIAKETANTEILNLLQNPTVIKKQEVASSVKRAEAQNKLDSAGYIYGLIKKDVSTSGRLVSFGKNVNAADAQGFTVLMVAVAKNDMQVAQLLLDAGANVNARNKEGECALLFAANKNYNAMIKLLISRGANVNIKTNKGLTALMCASTRGYTEVVKTLLENGATVEETDYQGKTALLYAANTNSRASARLLLSAGANPNAKDMYENTPITWAKRFGYTQLLAILQGAKSSE